jgi:dTDP-4-dehydrorhamnose 3,5-epimerase-like enzyme
MEKMEIKLIQLQKHGDSRGSLVALEDQKEVPFPIRRVYYMFDCEKEVRRGFHAHKKLRQFLIPVRGSCTFVLDNSKERVEVVLDDPAKGLLVEPMVWHEMGNFSEDCTLMALADAHYDESDYIRDYEEFLQHAGR